MRRSRRLRRVVARSAALASVALLIASVAPASATHLDDTMWRRYPSGSYNYSVWYYFNANVSTTFQARAKDAAFN